jgi:hypothetical protein
MQFFVNGKIFMRNSKENEKMLEIAPLVRRINNCSAAGTPKSGIFFRFVNKKIAEMKVSYCFASIFTMFLPAFLLANGRGIESAFPDSLIDIDHVYEYTYSDFDKAKIIMEELRKRGEEPEYDLDRTEGDLY